MINSYPHFFPDNPLNRYNTSKITQENIIRQYADIDLRDSTDEEEGRNQNHPLVKYLKEYNDLMGMDLTIPEFVVLIKHNKAKFTKNKRVD
jgi:predicted Ser/Thr protein kinase